MKRLFKTFGNIAFLALMSAVVLRPVVVEAGQGSGFVGGLTTWVTNTSHRAHSHSHDLSFRLSKPSKSSNLKVIPKETVSVFGLAPRFAESGISLNSTRQSIDGSFFRSHSFQKFLVLRI